MGGVGQVGMGWGRSIEVCMQGTVTIAGCPDIICPGLPIAVSLQPILV